MCNGIPEVRLSAIVFDSLLERLKIVYDSVLCASALCVGKQQVRRMNFKQAFISFRVIKVKRSRSGV